MEIGVPDIGQHQGIELIHVHPVIALFDTAAAIRHEHHIHEFF